MACADPDDNLELIAAALSALTNKEIVTKKKYDSIQREARSGRATGYVFRGVVDVPQLIEQTYHRQQTQEVRKVIPEKIIPVRKVIPEEVRKVIPEETYVRNEPKRGYFGTFFKVAGVVVGGVGATVGTAALLASAPVSVPILVGATVLGVGAAAGGKVGGAVGGVVGDVVEKGLE